MIANKARGQGSTTHGELALVDQAKEPRWLGAPGDA